MSGRSGYIRSSVVAFALLIATLLGVYAISATASEADAGEGESGRVALQEPHSAPMTQDPVRDPQIVGGSTVPDGKYPFMAFLEIHSEDGSVGYCGGSLIDNNSILTAAHCLDTYDLYGVRVYVGRTALGAGSQGVVRYAEYYEMDPRYVGSSNDLDYDSAILTLDEPVKTSVAKPVKLATTAQDAFETPGRALTVAGWGTTREGGSVSSRMREVSVPVVSDTSARRAYPGSFTPALMVAAGQAGKDSCQGDSGGPLFARTSAGFTQVGIVSYGNGCGRAGYPGIYTEVNNSSVRNFIVRASAAPY